MKRVLALLIIAVSVTLFACKDASAPAPAGQAVASVEPVAAGRAALVVGASMKSIETSALDAATRLTLSMTTTPDVAALRVALTELGDFAAVGSKGQALSSATTASALLARVDPAERNPDAAAIRLVISGAFEKLSQ